MSEYRFLYSVVASSLHDPAAVTTLTGPVRDVLDELGGACVEVAESETHGPTVPHLFVVATGGTERLLLDAISTRATARPSDPIMLISHPGHNSLPAALETLAAMQQTGGRGRIVSLVGASEVDRRVLEEAIGDLEAVVALRSTRLGVIGGASSWLVASSPEPDVVHRRWGPEVVTVEPTRMIELTRTPVVPTGVLAERFTKVADPVRSTVDRQAVDHAMGVRSALVDVLDNEELDAVTVRCFDLLGDPGTSGCLALGQPERRRHRRRVRRRRPVRAGDAVGSASPRTADLDGQPCEPRRRSQRAGARPLHRGAVDGRELRPRHPLRVGDGSRDQRPVRSAAGDVDPPRGRRSRRVLDRRGGDRGNWRQR